MKQRLGFAPILTILIIGVILALGDGVLYFAKQHVSTPLPLTSQLPSNSAEPTATTSTTIVPLIKVISPMGNENLPRLSVFKIKYAIADINSLKKPLVRFELWRSGVLLGNIGYNVMSPGYVFSVSSDPASWFYDWGSPFYYDKDTRALKEAAINTDGYKIRVILLDGDREISYADSNGSFIIAPETKYHVNILFPNNGESLVEGKAYTIKWETNVPNQTAGIGYYPEGRPDLLGKMKGAQVLPSRVDCRPVGDGYCSWIVPIGISQEWKFLDSTLDLSKGFRMQVTMIRDSETTGRSDMPFYIVPSQTSIQSALLPINVVSPTSTDYWRANNTQTIRWDKIDLPSGVKLRISYGIYAVAGYPKLLADNPSNTGSYQWTVPSDIVPENIMYAGGSYILIDAVNPDGTLYASGVSKQFIFGHQN